MKVKVNYCGTIKEIEEVFSDTRPYKEKVIEKIRQKYSIDDEIAIIRQKETKPEEFQEYFDFVEECKSRSKL